MKSFQQKLMESLTENVPAQIEQPKQLAAGDDVLVDWDGETVTCIVVSVTDEIVKVNRVIDGETVDRDYTLSQIQSLEEPIAAEVVTEASANVINVGDTVEKSFASDEADYHRKFKVVKITNGKADLIEISNGRKTSIYVNDLTKINESVNESVALTALVQQWDDMYDENFAKEYPEAFKKMKAKNSKTLTDIEAVWLDLYGEQFKDEYQGVYNALSKTLNESVNESKKFKNTKSFEKFLEEIDSMREADIRSIMGKNYVDTPGMYKDKKSDYDDVVDYMEKNMSSKDLEKLEAYWKLNVSESVNESLESEQFINRIKALDAKFELYHHNTGSFAKHKTFDDIYTEFDQLEDDLIEKIMGYTGEKYAGVNIDLVYSDNTGQELVNDLMNLGSDLQEFAKANGYDDIEQYGQTIHGLGAKLNYLLTFNENVSEAVVNDKESFKEYAETVMKQAHGDAYDQAIVDKMVDDIAAEVGDDWGAGVGKLTSGLGEALKALPDATSNGDGIAMRTESKDLAPKEYDALSDKDKKRYVYNKETDTWMFDSTISEAVDKEDDEAKSKEYDAGFAAGEDDTVNEEDCPYEEGTDKAKDWCEGFKAGCKK